MLQNLVIQLIIRIVRNTFHFTPSDLRCRRRKPTQSRNRSLKVICLSLVHKFTAPASAIQIAITKPKLTNKLQSPMTKGIRRAETIAVKNAHFNLAAKSGTEDFFHRAIGPIPIKNMAGAMIGIKTASK